MSPSASRNRPPDDGRPFGADRERPVWPVAVSGTLFGLWFLALLWMAIWHTSPR
jgi:hypothetical protein